MTRERREDGVTVRVSVELPRITITKRMARRCAVIRTDTGPLFVMPSDLFSAATPEETTDP